MDVCVSVHSRRFEIVNPHSLPGRNVMQGEKFILDP